MLASTPCTGYIEGYYGNLLNWPDRRRIVEALSVHGMNSYCYAPKEDPCHRLHWREPYSEHWRESFRTFSRYAKGHGIQVLAGVAPGLDFDFAQLPPEPTRAQSGTFENDDPMHSYTDFSVLVNKAQQLLSDGADSIVLLMDDIDEDFATRCGAFESEGEAHATLCNALNTVIGQNCIAVPRIYANELAIDSPSYLGDFVRTLSETSALMYCGQHIVAENPQADDLVFVPAVATDSDPAQEQIMKQRTNQRINQRIIFWDNLYANDYCPRRLFTGAWTGREQCQEILLNPTGMIETDLLLLAIMARSMKTEPHQCAASERLSELEKIRFDVLKEHGVPDCFKSIAAHLDKPHYTDSTTGKVETTDSVQLEAIETLLWKWKSALALEWYPYLMGLRHDLALAGSNMEVERIYKSQPPALARLLINLDVETPQ